MNNKGTDQDVWACRLICAFVVRIRQNPLLFAYGKKRFSHDVAHLILWVLTNMLTQIRRQTCYGPGHAKMCLMSYANNKGADQSAHPRSLISTFVIRCLDSMICILAISNVSRF